MPAQQWGRVYRRALVRRALLGAAAILASCSGAHEQHAVATTEVARAHVAPTADVPALLGVSIDGLRRRLGAAQPPPASLQVALEGLLVPAPSGALDSVVTFRTGGLTMVASYDIHSRQVRDLLLLGHHEDSLMGRARLRANEPHYLVLPVFYAGNASRLLGLRVIVMR